MSTNPRIVLFPHGQPEDPEPRASCARQVLALGGDVHRMIEPPAGEVDRFIEHLQRIRGIADGTEKPMIVLVRTHPLAWMVINTRRRIEQSVPALRNADWLLFVDPDLDPFFDRSAPGLGRLEERGATTTWIGPGETAYRVLRRSRPRKTPRPPRCPSPAP